MENIILKNISELNKLSAGILINKQTLLSSDLALLPVVVDGKIGFINANAEIIIEPEYDKIKGTFYTSEEFVCVYKGNKCGVINSEGELILDVVYNHIMMEFNSKGKAANRSSLFTVSKNNKKAVLLENGREMVSFGKYDWIDGFDSGLARVKKDGKWGIINCEGEIVLPIEYDSIWNFYKKNRETTHVIKNGNGRDISLLFLVIEDESHYDNDYRNDEACENNSAYDNEYYNGCLDMDQQSQEFWDSI